MKPQATSIRLAKPMRIEDRDLIEQVQKMPCTVCGRQGGDAHHVTSQGAGGGDTADNLMPLCRFHHTEIHQIGYRKAIRLYHNVGTWLVGFKRMDIFERSAR